MGFALLDLTFRLEKSFGTKLPNDWCLEAFDAQERDVQAKGLYKSLVRALQQTGRPVPYSSWHRMQFLIGQICDVSPRRVKPNTWLKRELGFTY